jgi:LAO/AO transport system kinase
MSPGVSAIADGARAGHVRDIARLISLIEDGGPEVPGIISALSTDAGRARTIGITGAPGVGKSTLTGALVGELRRRGERVGVLAVDPSSPFSGGALLGDRIRMQEHATDEDVFIRSMASRGQLGGMAATTPQAIRVLDAAGFSTVLVETVGVGQSEVDVAAAADTSLVLLAPGMGDGIQAAKAGILEIGDIFVVNKADREGADATVRELRGMLALTKHHESGWEPPVLLTSAMSGQGIEELCDALDAHGRWLATSGEGDVRRRKRAIDEVEALALGMVLARLRHNSGSDSLEAAASAVIDGSADPYTAARSVVDAIT